VTPRTYRSRAATTIAAILLAAAAAPAGPSPGQQRTRPRASAAGRQTAQDDDTVRIGTDLVLLDVSVVDKENRPYFEFDKSKFAVTEDGAPQTITFFNKEETSISLGLLIDTSGSMRSKIETVVQAVTNLVNTNRPQDETAVIEFKDGAEVVEEFTTDERDVQEALEDIVANGQSALVDAVKLSADYVQKQGHHRRKALLLVTDGLERGSYYSYEQIAESLRQTDVRLYVVGFTQDLDQSKSLFKKSDKARAEKLLKTLAGDTGGRAFFPKDLSELGTISDEIAKDMRTVYVLGYYPSNEKRDGTFRRVEVKVLGDPKYTARTRSGYYADRE
jgi:Ca-activated chloride channel homolog